MIDFVNMRKELMNLTYQKITIIKGDLDYLIDSTPIEKFDKIKYLNKNFKYIENNHNKIYTKLDNFSKHISGGENVKYYFQITSLVLFLAIPCFGIYGYWIKRSIIPWISSIIVLLIPAPIFLFSGIEIAHLMLSLNFCGSIGTSVISGLTPSNDVRLGMYFSCLPKEMIKRISIEMYEYLEDFDIIYNNVREEMGELNKKDLTKEKLGTDKRNNTGFQRLIEYLEKNDIGRSQEDLDNISDINKKLKMLISLNRIIAGLLSMASCVPAKKSINYIDEFYCPENHGYMFRNVILYMISTIGFIITSAGLNKLIVSMRGRKAKALRGKKEFNDDLIRDDD